MEGIWTEPGRTECHRNRFRQSRGHHQPTWITSRHIHDPPVSMGYQTKRPIEPDPTTPDPTHPTTSTTPPTGAHDAIMQDPDHEMITSDSETLTDDEQRRRATWTDWEQRQLAAGVRFPPSETLTEEEQRRRATWPEREQRQLETDSAAAIAATEYWGNNSRSNSSSSNQTLNIENPNSSSGTRSSSSDDNMLTNDGKDTKMKTDDTK